MVRTRLAPTPSGFLHIGNLFNFLVIHALAERTGGHVLLRIDDADQARRRSDYVEDIFETLRWAGIRWHEGPRDAAELYATWSQRERKRDAERMIERLRSEGHLFACGCSRTQAGECRCEEADGDFERPGVSWKLRFERPMPAHCERWPSGEQTMPHAEPLLHPVVRQKDGTPSYQILSLADDVRFGIDAIVRGEDLLPSTFCQLQLAHLLGFTSFAEVRFVHHPLLTDEKGRKLSKSEGAMAVRWMRERGMDASPWREKAEAYVASLITS